MGIIDGLLLKAGYTKKGMNSKQREDRFYNSNNPLNQAVLKNTEQYLNAYQLVSYVGFCATLRAEEVAKTGWGIYKLGDKEEKIENLKVCELLNMPEKSNNTRWFNFCKTAMLHRYLDGNIFIVKDIRNMEGVVSSRATDLALINPANVDIIDELGNIVTSTTRFTGREIKEYRVHFANKYVRLTPEQIIHINCGSPYNMIRGMGIIQANSSLTEADLIQDMFTKAFLKGGAVANLVLSQLENADILQSDWVKLVNDFKIQYGQNKDPIIAPPAGTKVESLDLSLEQLQMVEMRRFSKEDIIMMFRIPRSYAGMESQYVSKTQDKIAMEEVLETDYMLFEAPLTEFVKQYENKTDIEFWFERNNTVDKEINSRWIIPAVANGIMSPYQGAKELQISGNEAPKEYYMGINMLPVEVNTTIATSDQKNVCGCGSKGFDESAGIESNLPSKKRQLLRAGRDVKKKIEKRIKPIVEDWAKSYSKRITENIEKAPDLDIKKIFDDGAEKLELRKNAIRFHTAGVVLGLDESNKIYGSEVSTDYKDIKLVVETLAVKYADASVESRKEEVRALVQSAVSEGWSNTELVKQFRMSFEDTFTGRNGWKADRIARTEAGHAYDMANYQSYKELGVQYVDVVGCIDGVKEGYDCLRTDIPVSEIPSLRFVPNHTGVIVPQLTR